MSSRRKLSGCDGPSDGVVVDAEAAEAGAVGKAAAEATREERDGDDVVVGALPVVEHAFMPVSFQERRKP
jgi:hypothetical protein